MHSLEKKGPDSQPLQPRGNDSLSNTRKELLRGLFLALPPEHQDQVRSLNRPRGLSAARALIKGNAPPEGYGLGKGMNKAGYIPRGTKAC